MKRVLITGVNGFIGRALKQKLLSQHIDVVGVDVEDGDIADIDLFASIEDEDISHVFHLASRVYVPDSWEKTFDFYSTNVMGTENVLEYCRRKKVGLTYVSAYLYGVPNTLPISESDPIKSNNPYAHSKFLAEQLCEFYAREFDVNITVIRPFNIYGVGQNENFLIPEIINQVLHSEQVKVMDLLPRRDFVFKGDVIDALILSAEKVNKYSVYNVGSGYSLSVQEVIDEIQQVAGTDKPIVSTEQIRRNELNDVVADISNIKEDLNWLPKTTFKEGVKQMINNQ